MEILSYLAVFGICFALGYAGTRWFARRNVPKFCPTCGQAVVRFQARGAGRFSDEQWDKVECPGYTALRADWESHYSRIVGHRKFPASFDQQTGKPR